MLAVDQRLQALRNEYDKRISDVEKLRRDNEAAVVSQLDTLLGCEWQSEGHNSWIVQLTRSMTPRQGLHCWKDRGAEGRSGRLTVRGAGLPEFVVVSEASACCQDCQMHRLAVSARTDTHFSLGSSVTDASLTCSALLSAGRSGR